MIGMLLMIGAGGAIAWQTLDLGSKLASEPGTSGEMRTAAAKPQPVPKSETTGEFGKLFDLFLDKDGDSLGEARKKRDAFVDDLKNPLTAHHIDPLPHFPRPPKGWTREDLPHGEARALAEYDVAHRIGTADRKLRGLEPEPYEPPSKPKKRLGGFTTNGDDPDGATRKDAALYTGPKDEKVLIQLWQARQSQSNFLDNLVMTREIGLSVVTIKDRRFIDNAFVHQLRFDPNYSNAKLHAAELRSVFPPGRELKIDATLPVDSIRSFVEAIDFEGLGHTKLVE